jgi:predicted nuclease with TOPRIM domain
VPQIPLQKLLRQLEADKVRLEKDKAQLLQLNEQLEADKAQLQRRNGQLEADKAQLQEQNTQLLGKIQELEKQLRRAKRQTIALAATSKTPTPASPAAPKDIQGPGLKSQTM